MEKATTNTLLMSGIEFLKDLNEDEGVGYVMIVKPNEEPALKQAPTPV